MVSTGSNSKGGKHGESTQIGNTNLKSRQQIATNSRVGVAVGGSISSGTQAGSRKPLVRESRVWGSGCWVICKMAGTETDAGVVVAQDTSRQVMMRAREEVNAAMIKAGYGLNDEKTQVTVATYVRSKLFKYIKFPQNDDLVSTGVVARKIRKQLDIENKESFSKAWDDWIMRTVKVTIQDKQSTSCGQSIMKIVTGKRGWKVMRCAIDDTNKCVVRRRKICGLTEWM